MLRREARDEVTSASRRGTLAGRMRPLSRRSCAALLLVAVLAGCSTTTRFVNTWKAPDAAPLSLRSGDVVVAMVISRNEGTRRSGEDALAAELSRRGLRVIPAYTILT